MFLPQSNEHGKQLDIDFMKDTVYHMDSGRALVLSSRSTGARLIQLGLVFTAVLLPAVAHLSGAPVRWLLPMHWPVVFAALVYGIRGGVTVGALAPATNYLLTGYPLLVKALPMTFELAAYGLVIGWLRQKGWNSFAAVATGLAAGRIIFLGILLLTGANEVPFGRYLVTAMVPGLAAGAGQVLLLSVLVNFLFSKHTIK